jgi:WD40 repeat protein
VSRVAPSILKELEKNAKSTAFQGYELLDRDDGRPSLSHWATVENGRVSGVDWNPHATRIVTGVAARSPHDDWCKHGGSVQVWSLSATSDATSQLAGPSLAKTTSSCVTCVEYHPFEVNIVAAGTYNGEVVVWDLNRDEDVRMASSAKYLGSEVSEAVTCLTFMKKNFLGEAGSSHLTLLASGGLDGKIFLWAVNPVSEEMRLLKR